MAGFGLLIVIVGAWMLYSAITNQAPIKTIIAIAADPANARAILEARGIPISVAQAATGAAAGALTGSGDAVAFARSKIGQPYVLGGHRDGGWDCSGLVMEAIKISTGITLAHSATAQLLDPRGKKIAKADLQPGDVVFPNMPPFSGGHVQIYSGNGNIIEAPKPGTPVREVPMWGFYTARRFSRPTPAVRPAQGGNAP